jgi:site-specific DNA recombinase
MELIEQKERPMRAAVYMRVSTRGQGDDDRYSLPIQEERARAFCKSQDYALEDKHLYTDKISGATPISGRPDLTELFAAAERGEFDTVIVLKLDRIARDLFEFLSIIRELKKFNITFCSITESVDTSTIFGQLAVNIAGAFAEFERGVIRERTMSGKLKAAETGKWVTGIPPYGYKVDKETRKLVLVPTEGKVVEQIYKWLVNDNLPLAEIERRMNQKKIPAPYSTKIQTRETNDYWYKRTLGRILTNEVYTGTFYYRKYKRPFKNLNSITDKRQLRPRKEWVPMQTQPVISSEMFEAAKQRLLKNREMAKRNRKREYLYSKLIFCNQCQYKMFGGFQPPRKNLRGVEGIGGRYYHGTYRKEGAVGTSKRCEWCPQYSERRLEPIWESLKEILKNPANMYAPLERYIFKEVNPVDIEARLSEIVTGAKSILHKLERANELYINGQIDQKQFDTYHKEYKIEERKLTDEETQLRQTLLTKKEKTDRSVAIKNAYEKVKNRLENVSYEDKARIISMFVERITLFAREDHAQVVFKFPSSTNVEHTKHAEVVSSLTTTFPLVLDIRTISEIERRAEILRANPAMFIPRSLV